jgi:hypothetical protein
VWCAKERVGWRARSRGTRLKEEERRRKRRKEKGKEKGK